MTETIRGLAELLDLSDGIDSVGARTAALPFFECLGPPDLCRVTKGSQPRRSSGASPTAATSAGSPIGEENGSSPEKMTGSRAPSECSSPDKTRLESGDATVNFFHYVIGLDVADASHASQYISSMIDCADKSHDRGKWMISKAKKKEKLHIRGGTYCCFDAFNRVDIRVEVKIPGMPGVDFHAVDPDGNRIRVVRQFWEGAQLSALLRALVPPLTAVPALRVLPMLGQPEPVHAIVKLAVKNFDLGDQLGPVTGTLGGTNTNALCELLGRFLVGSRRLKQALQVFPSLQSMCPTVVIHIARAYSKRRQVDAALHVLARAIRQCPEDAPALHCQAKMLLKAGDCPMLAVAAAHLAVQLFPSAWRFWITLAKAYLQAAQIEECLAALNANPLVTSAEYTDAEMGIPKIPPVPLAEARGDLAFAGLLALRPTAYTIMPKGAVPQFGGFGPGFGLNPGLDDTTSAGAQHEPEKEALQALTDCIGASLTLVERRAYSVLLAAYREHGWDELLARRSNLFVVAEDGDCSPGRMGGGLAYRICTPFLDRLFQALHADLSLFSEWCENGHGHHRGCAALWMHRGALAARLQQDARAETAFRLCQARGTCPLASLNLLRIYATCARPVEVVAQLSVLCGIASLGAGIDNPRPWATTGGWPDWLFETAAKLVCSFGLAAMHAGAGQLPKPCHPYRFALVELLQAVQAAAVEGFDR